MDTFRLSEWQDQVSNFIDAPSVFLQGPAGAGKTTAAVARLASMHRAGVDGSSILVLVPQRTLASPYLEYLLSSAAPAGGTSSVLTVGGLARRMVDLFWPLISRVAGFSHPNRPPRFLTLETAQYFMAHLVRPLLDEGLFSSVTIDRNRLYSQILDNLNKAAITGFDHSQIGDRLSSAWVAEAGQSRIYADVQRCASLFRQYCLENNLLDFSLQLEIFTKHLWSTLLCSQYLRGTYRHLIFDNVEEDIPVSHDLVKDWMADLESVLLVFDQDAGYRRFLGADSLTAYSLGEWCKDHISITHSLTTPPALSWIAQETGYILEQPVTNPDPHLAESEIPARINPPREQVLASLRYPPISLRFYPQMLDWVVEEVSSLVNSGVPPGEIAILSPYLPDALRFALSHRLEQAQIHYRSHRPSRSLRDEPATHCLLTLAQLARPDWGLTPSKFDVAYSLCQAIEGMDLVRAQLLADIVYRQREGKPALSSFDQIKSETQQRITYLLGGRYETLRKWLAAAVKDEDFELDFFISRLFGEILSQPGFGFHSSFDAGRVTANLIESVQKFRWAMEENDAPLTFSLGKEYIQMVHEGVIAAQYIQNWQEENENAVFLAPAYTFLMRNWAVDYQFWLDIGSHGWFERLNQPLTHPYVLSREWEVGRVWKNADEYEAMRDSLFRLVTGLTRRCRKGIYLGLSELNEQGYENRGLLLKVIQQVLQSRKGERNG